MESETKQENTSTKAVPDGFKILSEGQANILYHERESKADEKPKKKEKGKKMNKDEKDENRDAVFYNPAQEFNRDLSILCITEYGDQLRKVHIHLSSYITSFYNYKFR